VDPIAGLDAETRGKILRTDAASFFNVGRQVDAAVFADVFPLTWVQLYGNRKACIVRISLLS
jgi:hypothetical protein